MVADMINHQRIHQQGLGEHKFSSPEAVVSHLGAVQAQDYYGAKWSVAMRMQSATDDLMEAALNEGRILRTHIMRPTWHLVLPEDIRWIMKLTAHRVHMLNDYYKRQAGLDDELLIRTNDLIAKALEGGVYLTRNEIADKLAESGIEVKGQHMTYIMLHAELELIACSGPRRGKQFTYALLDERAPQGKHYQADEALAELTRRYVRGHAPASERDFSWWSGLTLTEARRGLDMIATELDSIESDGEIYYFLMAMPPETEPVSRAILIPTFDELYVGYTSYAERISAGREIPGNYFAESPIVLGTRIVGTWRRKLKAKSVDVTLSLFEDVPPTGQDALHEAVEQYARFLGLSANTSVTQV